MNKEPEGIFSNPIRGNRSYGKNRTYIQGDRHGIGIYSPRIEDAVEFSKELESESETTAYMSKIENAQTFSELFNMDFQTAFEQHDLLAQKIYPDAKTSPESLAQTLGQVLNESWQEQKFKYVKGLIYAGDDSPELLAERERLREVTKDGDALERSLQQMSIEGQQHFRRLLLENAEQVPQYYGMLKETFGFMYGSKSYGYYDERFKIPLESDSPETIVNSWIYDPLKMATRSLTAGARYSHIIQSGELYEDLENTLKETGIELTPEQQAEADEIIRSYTNMYTAIGESGKIIDAVLMAYGVKAAAGIAGGMAGATGLKAAFKTVIQGIGKWAGASASNIFQEGVEEYFQTMTTEAAKVYLENLAVLKDKGTITPEQFFDITNESVDALGTAMRISTLPALATGGFGLGVGAVDLGVRQLTNRSIANANKKIDEIINTDNKADEAIITNPETPSVKVSIEEDGPFVVDGALGQEEIKANQHKGAKPQKVPPKDRTLGKFFEIYNKAMAKAMEIFDVRKPLGDYSIVSETIENVEKGEFRGSYLIKYVQSRKNDKGKHEPAHIEVTHSSQKHGRDTKYSFDITEDQAGRFDIVDADNTEPRIKTAMRHAAKNFVRINMRSGRQFDWDSLNLDPGIKELGKRTEEDPIDAREIPMQDIHGNESFGTVSENLRLTDALKKHDSMSAEYAAIQQILYYQLNNKIIATSAQKGFTNAVMEIRLMLKNAQGAPISIRAMKETMLKAGVYPATKEDLKDYETLLKRKPNPTTWSRDEEFLARVATSQPVGAISLEALNEIHDAISLQVANSNSILDKLHRGRHINAAETVHIAIGELEAKADEKGMTQGEVIEQHAKDSLARKIKRSVSAVKSLDNLVASLTGTHGSLIYDTLMRQPREQGREAARAAEAIGAEFEDSLSEVKTDSRSTSLWRIKKTKFGNYSLTNGELMSLYMHDKSPENRTHLVDGIDSVKNGKMLKIPPEVVQQAVEHAKNDPTIVAIGKIIDRAMQRSMLLERATLRRIKGDPKLDFGNDNYFRIHISEHKDDVYGVTDLDTGERVISTNKQMLQSRTSDKHARIMLTDAFTEVQNTIEQATKFAFQEISFWKASNLLFDPEFKAMVMNLYSKMEYDYLVKGLVDMASQKNVWVDQDPNLANAVRMLMRARTMRALAYAPISAMKAWTSVFGVISFADMDVSLEGIFSHGTLEGAKGVKKLATELSAVYRSRVKGGLYPELMRSGPTDSMTKLAGQKVADAAFWMMTKFDADASARAWYTGYLQVQKDFKTGKVSRLTLKASGITPEEIKNLDTHEVNLLAIQVGDYLMNISQPSFEVETRSAIQRGGILGVMFSQFGSSVGQQRQQIIEAFEIMKSDDPDKYQAAGQIFASVAMQAMAYSAVGAMGSAVTMKFLGGEEGDALRELWVGFANALLSVGLISKAGQLRIIENTKNDVAYGAPLKETTFKLAPAVIPALIPTQEGKAFLKAMTTLLNEDASKDQTDDAIMTIVFEIMNIGLLSNPMGSLPMSPINMVRRTIDNIENR